ncbi:MAG TPA: CoA transferase [Caulobacteraceae bacterium]|jgi:crotonobetainyl-CoA:carnitine CoA-transferase CaiB-like acyl-CoA transferase
MTAFAGLRVLDFSGFFAGAMAAMHLGDFGAEVIKVDPTSEERGRTEPGYLAWNRNKTRLVLDLQKADDLAAAKALLADADVAIFDQAPGVLEALGLDGKTLTAMHPRLVHAWAPPYGETGRWSKLPPSHTLLSAITGIARRQPSYAGSPVNLVSPQAFYAQANVLAAAIGAALFERAQSGLGQTVMVSGLHGASECVTGTVIAGAPMMAIWGSPRGGAPSYRLYQCADGEFFFLGALFANFYMRALDATEVLGEILAHPEFNGELDAALVLPGARITAELLEAKFRSKTRAEWMDILAAFDVPRGPVKTREAWLASETMAANRMRVELQHPELGTVTMPASSVKLSGTPAVAPQLCKTADKAPPRAATPAASKGASPATPLQGVKVLDLGNVIAAPFAATILASFGAEVIKVESREGDPFRMPPTFLSYNRGKRGLALDMKHEEAVRVFLEMVAKADVVLDNFRFGVRERLGITYEQLKKVNPRIISLSVTGYGDDVARQTLPAFDPLLQAESGQQQAQGGYGNEPVMHQIPVNDITTAAMASFAVVGALLARERTGEGQEITTSLATTSVMAQIGQMVTYPGGPAPAMGAPDCIGVSALERFYECQDDWIAIACTTPASYTGLCEALGLAGDVKAALAEPIDGPVATAIAAALKGLSRDAALARLEAAGAPAVPCITGPESNTDAYLQENGYHETYEHARGMVTGAPGYAKFGRTQSSFQHAAPLLAEHSVAVLTDYGIAPERIESLLEIEAVFQA